MMEKTTIELITERDSHALFSVMTEVEPNQIVHQNPPVDRLRTLVALLEEKSAQLPQPRFVYLLHSETLRKALEDFCRRHALVAINAKAKLSVSTPDTTLPFDFAARYDDGQEPHGILEADLIITGISRTQKTPLSVYLASRHIRAANVPLVPEIPPPLELFRVDKTKVVGLTAGVDRLKQLREERLRAMGLPLDAMYAKRTRIEEEIDYANRVMRDIGCPVIDVTTRAVEETAEMILKMLGNGSANCTEE